MVFVCFAHSCGNNYYRQVWERFLLLKYCNKKERTNRDQGDCKSWWQQSFEWSFRFKQKYGYNLLSVCLESANFTPKESAKLKVALWTQGELWPGLTAVSSGCLAPIDKNQKNCLRACKTHFMLPDSKANRFGSSFRGTYTFAPNRTKPGFCTVLPHSTILPQHELGTRVKNTKIIRFTAELHLAIISYQYLDLKTPTELYIQ